MTAAIKHFTQSNLLFIRGLSFAGRTALSVRRSTRSYLRRAIRQEYLTVGEWNLNSQQNTQRNDVLMTLIGERPNKRMMILFEEESESDSRRSPLRRGKDCQLTFYFGLTVTYTKRIAQE